MKLHKFQQLFHEYLLSNNDSELQKFITSGSLHIYKKNYIFTHLNTLKKSYPATYQILGENNFNFFAREYILKMPSQDSNLDKYGLDFPQFLKSQSPLSKDEPYLFDLAHLESLQSDPDDKNITLLLNKGTFHLWQHYRQWETYWEADIDLNNKECVQIFTHKGHCQVTLLPFK